MKVIVGGGVAGGVAEMVSAFSGGRRSRPERSVGIAMTLYLLPSPVQ
jgi:hypothetical protein